MNRRPSSVVRAVVFGTLALCVLGHAGDATRLGACDSGFSIKFADELCRDTGGSWIWKELRCQCSSERPNWANGVGCLEIDGQCADSSGCPVGYVCSQSKCVAGSCADECPYENARKCESVGRSSVYRICGQFDDDPCVEWSPATSSCPGEGSCVDDHCNLLRNGDFEDGLSMAPSSWNTAAWGTELDVWRPDDSASHAGARCASVEFVTAGDAWWEQRVTLAPRAPYTLFGWIKGENIATGVNIPPGDQGNVGATLSVVGTWSHTEAEGSLGTYDWKPVVLTFLTEASGEASIGCRLGYWCSHVTGKAWFDDIVLSGDDFTTRSGEHIVLHLEHKDVASIAAAKLTRWLEHLDRAYKAYQELVGGVPYDGETIHVLSVRHYPGGWAVAGNPIQWMQAYVHETLVNVSQQDDWSFGILHEIGHDFDLQDRWNFHAEFFANLKLYAVLSQLDGQVVFGGGTYRGAALSNYYNQRYAAELESGTRTWGDSMVYRFIQISEQIGWGPFHQTFRFFNGLSSAQVPSTKTDKFNLFVSKLGEYSGADVRGMFTTDELTWIAAELSKQ